MHPEHEEDAFERLPIEQDDIQNYKDSRDLNDEIEHH